MLRSAFGQKWRGGCLLANAFGVLVAPKLILSNNRCSPGALTPARDQRSRLEVRTLDQG